MADISGVSTEALAAELATRDDLFGADGRLGDGAFKLADTLGTRVCVDGAPVRLVDDSDSDHHRRLELMAIRRGTGPYAGNLCLVGGGVRRVKEDGQPESFEEALGRHFRTDLGWEIEPLEGWERPHHLAQDMRPDDDGEVQPGFTPNPASGHLVAARFIVKVTDGEQEPTFGSTDVGGQEAVGVQWFSQQDMDDLVNDPGFGYGHEQTYRSFFRIAHRLLGPAN